VPELNTQCDLHGTSILTGPAKQQSLLCKIWHFGPHTAGYKYLTFSAQTSVQEN